MKYPLSLESLDQAEKDKLDALTFRRFLQHLDDNKNVQNIDLMIKADFCRNCLSKWYLAEAEKLGLSVSEDDARERIYGMPYSDWKSAHQTPATDEQMKAYQATKIKKNKK